MSATGHSSRPWLKLSAGATLQQCVGAGIEMIARRRLVVGLTFGAGLGRRANGQDRPKIIGSLTPYTSAQSEPFRELFSRSMLDLVYVNGKHFLVLERLAAGHNERLRELARAQPRCPGRSSSGLSDALWGTLPSRHGQPCD